MKPEWIELDGSDEQIAEIASAENGILIEGGKDIEYPKDRQDLNNLIVPGLRTRYLICQPHPLADMICQQARTGQPVWIKIPLQNDYTLAAGTIRIGDVLVVMGKHYCIIETHFPNWHIPGAKYSFTPFEGEPSK
jgi:hypothetical protein